jgi:hypothetical protein
MGANPPWEASLARNQLTRVDQMAMAAEQTRSARCAFWLPYCEVMQDRGLRKYPELGLRKPMLYPLSYEGGWC